MRIVGFWLWVFCAVTALFGLAATSAIAENRVALVVGNSAYQHTTALPNPSNDAQAIADKLTTIGFKVFLHKDLSGQGFRVALGDFSEAALNADIALFFYAGHGIEMAGQNYLIPIDAQMRSEAAAQFEALPLEQVLSAIRSAKKLGMVMLDACRDNPFANTMTRSVGTRSVSRGLAAVSVEGEKGLLISFAAEAGRTAADGLSSHSPYTEALLETIDQPGLEIGRIFRTVRAKVREKSGGQQVPVETAQLPDEDIYLVSSSEAATIAAEPKPIKATPAPAAEDPLLVYLDAVQKQNRKALEDFIRRYPDHERAKDARALVLSMAENDAWETAKKTQTEDGYRNFVTAFPSSPYAAEARTLLAAYEVPAPKPDPLPLAALQAATAPTKSGFQCPLADGDASVTGIDANDTLFLRKGPGTNFDQIGALAYNSNGITINSCSKKWCQVQQGCLKGYVAEKYITLDVLDQTVSDYTGIYFVSEHPETELLNVRSGPGKTFEIVNGLPFNAAAIDVLDCQPTDDSEYPFCYLRWGDVSGWASGRYLTQGN